ncbi:MAG: cysteine synthase A [Clostridia bacterium]|nr:cysteine synthase A [Clostridia bacterium]
MAVKVGNTSLVQLHTMQEKYGWSARIFAKLERENEGGSIKDRVALAILNDAESKGLIEKGGAVVEATSGNTGIGLALVCRARGYRAIIVMPDSMSVERQELLKSYGAELVLTDGKEGMQAAVERAKEIVKTTPNSLLADQFNNPVCAQVHYDTTGVEIWEQTAGNIDIFVACVGTGGTLTGVGKYLKEQKPQIQVVAVEPASSPLLSQGRAGAHKIQGIGANFIPAVLDRQVYNEVVTVTDEDAFAFAKALKSDEGLSVGISSGAALAAAAELAKRAENKGKRIVTIFPDDGNRYNSVL